MSWVPWISLTSYSINLINEYYTRCSVPCCRKKIPHPSRTNTNIQLIKFTCTAGEEWNPSLTSNSSSQHCFSSTRWSNKQNSFWKLTTKTSKPLSQVKQITIINITRKCKVPEMYATGSINLCQKIYLRISKVMNNFFQLSLCLINTFYITKFCACFHDGLHFFIYTKS